MLLIPIFGMFVTRFQDSFPKYDFILLHFLVNQGEQAPCLAPSEPAV